MKLTGRYEIPRQFRGEDRILGIFRGKKSLLYTLIGLGITSLFIFLFSLIKHPITGFIIGFPFPIVGYFLGTYQIPKESRISGGEDIDKHLFRIYKRKRKKIIYTDLFREE